MASPITVRLARAVDGPALAAIYGPVVARSAASFELQPPTAEQMADRVQATMPAWPWLVAEQGPHAVGYAYASAHRARPAYAWTTEVSAYVAAPARGRGVGRRLYTALLALLAAQGYRLAVAGITLPNPASVKLHLSLGFRQVGTLHAVGHKLGRWHDVSWWQRSLDPGGCEGPGGSEGPEGRRPGGLEGRGPGGCEGPGGSERPGGPEGPEGRGPGGLEARGPEGCEGPEGSEGPGGCEDPEGRGPGEADAPPTAVRTLAQLDAGLVSRILDGDEPGPVTATPARRAGRRTAATPASPGTRRRHRIHSLLAIEGLALARTGFLGDEAADRTRVAEVVELCRRFDRGELSGGFEVREVPPAQGYEIVAGQYDQRANPLIAAEEPIMRQLLDAVPAGRALDAACGTGRLASWLVGRGHRVVGMDSSPAMLRRAVDRVPDAWFALADLTALPLPDAAVDLVVCGLALTHCPDLGPPLQELARVLRPGGTAALSDLHPLATLFDSHVVEHSRAASRVFVRNHVHLQSDYLAAFRAVGLGVEECHEPLVDEAGIAAIDPDDTLRDAVRQALVGLPMALVWRLRRR